MALTTNQLIVGMFNAAAGGYKADVATYIANGGAAGVNAAAAALLSQSPLGAQFLGQSLYSTKEAFSAAVVSSLLPALPASTMASVNAAVTGFWALNPSLTRSELVVKLIEAVVAIPATDALLGGAASSFNAKVALADAYTGTTKDMAVLQTVVGTTVTSFNLTTGADILVGSAGDDSFIARIQNNANTAQSGDKIDGGAGNDYLSADIGNSQNFAITLETTGVESVAIRAQAVANDSNNNNMVDLGNYGGQVQIDAQRMVGVTTWESNNSRADVVIEDVRILPGQITKDITIAFVESDPGQVDMGVYFDQLSLRNFSTTTSQMNLKVLDTFAASKGSAPLLDSPYGSFTFTASQNGVSKVYTLASKGMQDAQTYVELAAAMQAQLDAQFGAGNATATIGANFTVPDSVTSALVTGQTIVITAKAGSAPITFDTKVAGSGWLANDVVPAISGLYTSYDSDSKASTDLVTSKIILDDVGRGSTGGDLVVGGLSVGETSTSKGVERFEIEVRDNSKLQTINSTNNTLKEVVLVNGVTSSASSAYVVTVKDAGNLTVNGVVNPGDLAQNTALPGSAAQHNAYGFSDVRLIDGSTMSGKLAFTAEVTQASIAKYLNLNDVQAVPAADNVAFQYNGGLNADTITVVIDSAVAASRTLTGREDFSFTVDGGAGKDTISVDIGGNETGAWYFDQSMLRNITINGGSGDDTISTTGSGDFRIDAGADNDTVYINNTGATAVGAQWIVGAANADLTDLQGSSAAGVANQFLYKGTVTVVFSGTTVGTAGGVTSGAAARLLNGFEKTVAIPTGDNYGVTQYHVNQAIKSAINSDAVLSKLMIAEDGPGTTLVITSLVAGTFNPNDLDIVVAGANYATLPTAEQTTVLNAYKAFSLDSTASIAQAQTAQDATVLAKNAVEGIGASVVGANGLNSTDVTDNIINLGSGNDVLVLSTSAAANETLVYTGYGLGADTIVNFSTAGASTDVLDFSAYLTGKFSASGSTVSQQTIKTTLNGDNNVEANSVSVFKLTSNATQDFAGLTITNLLAAINSTNVAGVANYAGLQANTYDALTTYSSTSTLVGGVGKAVVLVENDRNLGEYKAFELTFNGTAATNATQDFSGAQLIANMDFGNSLAGLSVANLKGAVGALVTGASGVPVVPAFSVVATTTAAAEGTSATYTVSLSAAQTVATTVSYTLAGTGGATAADLVAGTALTGTLTFAPGTTSLAVLVPFAVDANTPEAGEAMSLTLSAPSAGTTLATAVASASITDVAPVGPVNVTIPVAAANVSFDAAINNNAFVVALGTYTYSIANFGALDSLAFPAGVAASVNNPSFTDGIVDLTYASGGQVVTIQLTGVSAANDGLLNSVADFNTVFGAGTIV